MNAQLQVIEKNGKPEWAVIPYDLYQQFVEAMEMLDDIRTFDEAKQRIADGEELIPSSVVYALLEGANPILVWRQHRGLTQQQLADKAGISKPYLSQIESGKRTGSSKVLNSLAQALRLTIDDLIVQKE